MSNITFLLGAGASFNAIPITHEIPLHLSIFADYIEKYIPTDNANKYVSDIRALRTHLGGFNTIDNYAMVLSKSKTTSNGTELKKLKSILSGLFMFEQLRKKSEIVNLYSNVSENEIERINRTIDFRYKSFFAKVLDKDKLDERINIISWNYDTQLEIGLESNLGYDYTDIQNSCGIYPHSSYEHKDEFINFWSWDNMPKIVKLNGTAGLFIRDNQFHHIYLNQKEFFEDRFDTIIDIHKEISRYNNYNPFLKFAWEKDDLNKRATEYARQIIGQTRVLVVIGYSFPDFNRPIDKIIFESNNIEEIFIQLPEEDVETVKYNMQSSLERQANKCIHIKNLREFFIPSQFIPVY